MLQSGPQNVTNVCWRMEQLLGNLNTAVVKVHGVSFIKLRVPGNPVAYQTTYMCQCLNSHYFPIVGVHIPITRIPLLKVRWPSTTFWSLDLGTHIFMFFPFPFPGFWLIIYNPLALVLYRKTVLRCFNKFTSFQHQLHMDWTWLHKFLGSEGTSRTAMVMVMGSEKTPVRSGCGELFFGQMTRSKEILVILIEVIGSFSTLWCVCFWKTEWIAALFQLIFLSKMLARNLENPREPKFFLRVPPSMDTSRHHFPHCDDSRCSRFNMAGP